MEDFDNIPGLSKPPSDDEGKSIPFEDNDSGPSDSAISHSPLNLGSSSNVVSGQTKPAPKASPPPQQKPITGGERITGVKTFFTKLHPGAITFLDEQINDWLRQHPDVRIKHTNVTVGEVQAKKSEENLIVVVWY